MRRTWWVFLALSACATSEVGSDGAPVDALVAPDAPLPDGNVETPDAAPDGMPDSGPPDAALSAVALIHDSAFDFDGPGWSGSDVTVESWGAVAPVAYFTGGLLHRASDIGSFTDPASTTWATVVGLSQTSRTAIARNTFVDWGGAVPPTVGLVELEYWSQTYEGEIWLDAGTWTFSYLADDHGMLELAPPASETFTRVINANYPDELIGTYAAGTSGWHRIRFAVSNATGGSAVKLRYTGPGVPSLIAIPRHRLRTRIDTAIGWVETAFDDANLLGSNETTIDTADPGYSNWGNGAPLDLGVTDSDLYAVRWSGQFRVAIAGAYSFRYQTDDGQRLWIDGVKLLDAWDDQTHTNITASVNLAVGWHDIVVDQTEFGGGAAAWLSIESGPEGAGAPIPLARMRPVEGRAERHDSAFDRSDLPIPDNGQVQSAVGLAAPTAAIVTGVDVSYAFTHASWDDLEVRLIAPNGTIALLRDNAGGNTSGTTTDRITTAAFAGIPASGTWTLRVNDTVAGATGTLQDFQLTVHYNGGEPPIPLAASYDSPMLDLVDPVSLDNLSWVEVTPPGTDILVRLRTGATPEACEAAAWSLAFTEPAGTIPTLAPARYLQYRVEFASTGDATPYLDSLQILYTRH